MAIKLEKVVEKFYQGLEEGKFLGRKCPACGAVEFPRYTLAIHAETWRQSGWNSAAKAR